MAPTPKWTKGQKRTKPNSSSKSLNQVATKPAESIQSEVFKMKRIFIRTFSTIDLIIKEKFGKNIIEFVNALDSPTKENLQSNKINDLFSQMDTEIGAIIQPPKPVTVNPLSEKQETDITMVMAKQQFTISSMEAKYDKLYAEMMALKQQTQDKEDENDLLTMPTDE